MTRPRDIADSINRINSSAADATAVTIDSSERVGIGETSPTVPLEVKGAQAFASSASNLLTSTTKATAKIRGSSDASTSLFFGSLTNDAEQYIQSSNGAGSAADDIALNPFGGKVLIGKTVTTQNTAGTVISATDGVRATVDQNVASILNRTTDDGQIVLFRKDGTTVGTINSRAGVVASFVFDPRSSGSGLSGGTSQIQPTNENGAVVDNTIDLGSATTRFKDLYLGQSITIKRAASAQVGTFGRNTDASQRTLFEFRSESQNATVGTIKVTNSTTHYLSGSDYRLKENITNITDGITRLKLLNPKRFNFISMPDNTVDGFIAHEASSVVPEAVSGEKDAMMDEEYVATPATGEIYTPSQEATFDEDGNELTAATNEVVHSTDVEKPDTLEEGRRWRETTEAVMATRSVPDYQAIDQAKLVPLLTAALQEAVAKIEALETRVAALEA